MAEQASPSPSPTLSFNDLQSHNSNDDCWIAVHSKVYDVTNFLDEHPGGSSSIFSLSSKEGLATYGS